MSKENALGSVAGGSGEERVKAVASPPTTLTMVKFTGNDGLTDRVKYPVLVERLTVGSVIFSKSYVSDAWLYLKNNHLMLAMFFAHPKHPFSKTERSVCLFCSILMGYGLTCAFDRVKSEPTKTVVSIVIGGVLQGVYDALLRIFAECLCVQRCPRCVTKCFEACGKVGIIFQFILGCTVLTLGLASFLSESDVAHLGGVTWRFALAKGASWILLSLLFCLVSFHFARKAQMRPAGSRRSFSEKEAHERWETPATSSCCHGATRAPSYYWNHYIGADVTYDQLPERAPQYRVRVLDCFCGKNSEDGESDQSPHTSRSVHVV